MKAVCIASVHPSYIYVYVRVYHIQVACVTCVDLTFVPICGMCVSVAYGLYMSV